MFPDYQGTCMWKWFTFRPQKSFCHSLCHHHDVWMVYSHCQVRTSSIPLSAKCYSSNYAHFILHMQTPTDEQLECLQPPSPQTPLWGTSSCSSLTNPRARLPRGMASGSCDMSTQDLTKHCQNTLWTSPHPALSHQQCLKVSKAHTLAVLRLKHIPQFLTPNSSE